MPKAVDDRPMFDRVALHRVSLALVVPDGTAVGDGDVPVLDVYLASTGAIRVVEDGIYDRPLGANVSRSVALRAAKAHLRQAGIDPDEGTLHVAAGERGGNWYLTLDREIAGYRVANAPMSWWLAGDKAYVELRPDASLVRLYAIRPEHRAAPAVLDAATLAARLAKVAHVSRSRLATYDLELLWVRPQDRATGAEDAALSLSYCATHRFADGWDAWCVDAGTGDLSTMGGGVD